MNEKPITADEVARLFDVPVEELTITPEEAASIAEVDPTRV